MSHKKNFIHHNNCFKIIIENKKLVKLQDTLNERETTLKNRKSELLKSQSNFDEDHLMFLQRRYKYMYMYTYTYMYIHVHVLE